MQTPRLRAGFTLLEMLCVIAIIFVLAALLLSAVTRAYLRAKRLKRDFETPALVEMVRERLTRFCETQVHYPALTVSQFQQLGVFDATIAEFLSSQGVVFHPFASTNSDDTTILELDGATVLLKSDLKPPRD